MFSTDFASFSVLLFPSIDIFFFLAQMTLTHKVNFPTRIPKCDSHSPAQLDLFFFLTLVFILQ